MVTLLQITDFDHCTLTILPSAMRLGDLADSIYWEPLEGCQMVSQMVSEINLSGERAGMGGSGADSERCCQ